MKITIEVDQTKVRHKSIKPNMVERSKRGKGSYYRKKKHKKNTDDF